MQALEVICPWPHTLRGSGGLKTRPGPTYQTGWANAMVTEKPPIPVTQIGQHRFTSCCVRVSWGPDMVPPWGDSGFRAPCILQGQLQLEHVGFKVTVQGEVGQG